MGWKRGEKERKGGGERGRGRRGRLSTKGNGGYERGSPNEFKYLNYKSRALGLIHGGAALEGGQLRRWRGKTELAKLVQPRNRPLRSEKKVGARKEKPTVSRERERARALIHGEEGRREREREFRQDWGICKRRESRTKPCRNHLSCRGGFHKLECDAAPPDRHTPV